MPFAYSVTKADVYNYWRDFEARQVAKRAITTRKEPPMSVVKSLSDLAWQAVAAEAQRLVDAKTFRTTTEAIDALKAASHPAYLVYLGSLSGGSTPPVTTAPGDVVKVVKQAEEQRFAKRRAVQAEINKRVDRLVRTRQAANEQEALSAVFKADRELYDQYRTSSYADGPLFPGTAPAPVAAPDTPAYATAKRLALEMRNNDPWGEHAAASEAELVEKVFTQHPALYQAVREESYDRG